MCKPPGCALPACPDAPAASAAVALARDLAVGESLLLLETDPVGNALRIMARRGVRLLQLADESGVFQGVLFDVDALRAFAG